MAGPYWQVVFKMQCTGHNSCDQGTESMSADTIRMRSLEHYHLRWHCSWHDLLLYRLLLLILLYYRLN